MLIDTILFYIFALLVLGGGDPDHHAAQRRAQRHLA